MTEQEQTSAPNIVLLVLDSVRRDVYNEEAARIQKKVDTKFTQMRSISNWSIPSHASMLTGQLPSDHGITTHQRDFSRVGDVEGGSVLRETLDEHSLLGVSSNFFCSSEYNFDYFFDEFVDVPNCGAFSPHGMVPREVNSDKSGLKKYIDYLESAASNRDTPSTLWNFALTGLTKSGLHSLDHKGDNGSARVLQQSLNLIKSADSCPWFLFMNLMDVHDPHYYHGGLDDKKYDLDKEWTSDGIDAEEFLLNRESLKEDVKSFRNYYRANIDYLDRKIADFIERVQNVSDKDVSFIITSDHGENLGYVADDRMLGHTSNLSEGVLHIPFDVINPPEGWPKKFTDIVSNQWLVDILRKISDKVNQIDDLVDKPTVSEVIGNTPPVFETNPSWWDRAIRAEYRNGEDTKITWDSINNVNEYTLRREQPNYQSAVSTPTLSEVRTKAVWQNSIIEMKREAIDLTEDTSKEDQSAVSRLKGLGYL